MESGVQNSNNPTRNCGILGLVASQPRNGNCLAGLKQGAQRCARESISNFATLVRKSYSDSLSLVSTLVLLERISYSASGLGSALNPKTISVCRPEFHEAARG
jgi:hypothetical protein